MELPGVDTVPVWQDRHEAIDDAFGKELNVPDGQGEHALAP